MEKHSLVIWLQSWQKILTWIMNSSLQNLLFGILGRWLWSKHPSHHMIPSCWSAGLCSAQILWGCPHMAAPWRMDILTLRWDSYWTQHHFYSQCSNHHYIVFKLKCKLEQGNTVSQHWTTLFGSDNYYLPWKRLT